LNTKDEKMKDMEQTTENNRISAISLVGAPYVTDEQDLNVSMNALAQNTGYSNKLGVIITKQSHRLNPLTDVGFYSKISQTLLARQNLSFDEAFCLSAFVASGTNKPLRTALESDGAMFPPQSTHDRQATALLTLMSAKEAYQSLHAHEIAGLVAGVLELDTIVRLPANTPVLCFGGMGGDKGYAFSNGSKLFSLSTLAAFTTSLSGLTHKHHSYPNTSKVAGQTTLEEFGARSDFTCAGEMMQVFNQSSLLMTSCHNTRTIHALSHVLRGETINHLIGPLAFTMSGDTRLQPFIGVNEKVHPQTVIEAMLTMQNHGVQSYDRGVVFCGLSKPAHELGDDEVAILSNPAYYYNDIAVKDLVRLDEIAPPPFGTLAAFVRDGEFVGNYIIAAEDFYPTDIVQGMRKEELLIPNRYDDIIDANHTALSGQDECKTRYLAMTVGLANFMRFSLHHKDALRYDTKQVNRDMLRAHTTQAYDDLKSGRAHAKMQDYCTLTQSITPSVGYRLR
jgi:anthranilate phosphoribosyltransferase